MTALERKGFYDSTGQDELKHSSYVLSMRRKVAEIFKNVRTKNNLDVGCGNGDFIIELSKIYPNLMFTGVDFSEYTIKIARESSEKLKNVEFSAGNVLELKFKDKMFDTVFCVNTLHHIKSEDLETALKEISRVCNENLIIDIRNNDNIYYRYIRTGFGKHKPKVENLIDVYPTTIETVRSILNEFFFDLVLVKPLWYLPILSPIVVLVFKRRRNTDATSFLADNPGKVDGDNAS